MKKYIKIIDIHTHIGFINNNFYDGERLHKILYKNKIEKAFLSSTSSGTVCQEYGNKEVYKFIKKHSKIFLGQIWINPYNPNWKKDAEKYLNKNFIGIKLHSSINRYKVEFNFLKPVFKFAKINKLSIFAHTEKKDWHSVSNYENIAKNFPSVRIILYHMSPIEKAVNLVRKYKNVFLETSGAKISDIKKAVRECGVNKVLFGSDAPIGFKGFSTTKANLKKKNYSFLIESFQRNFGKEDCKKILYENAKQIFNL